MALIALVGLVVRMGQQVGLQVAPLVEAALAHGTLVRALLHVQDLVDGQGPRLAEPFSAVGAFERLLFRMNIPKVKVWSYNGILLKAKLFYNKGRSVRPFMSVFSDNLGM